MRETLAVRSLTFVPVVHEQQPTAWFRQPVDEARGVTVDSALCQTFMPEPQEVSVELAPAAERQSSGDLARVVPTSIAQGFEHQEL